MRLGDHRPRMVLLIGGTLLAAAAAAQAGEPKLEARGLLRVERLASSAFPTSNVVEQWRVVRLVPIDRKHFLALVEHWRDRYNAWADPKQIRKERDAGGVVTSAGVQILHNRYALAVLRRDGKLVEISDEPAEAKIQAPLYPGTHAIPLVMDRTDACPYGLLEPTEGVLLCFDLDLHFIGRHRLPVDEIIGAKVTFDGLGYTLWLFGARYDQRPTAKTAKEVDLSPPTRPAGYGVRFTVASGSVEPLPIDPDELLDGLRRIARDPEGHRVELDPAGVRLRPFRDPDTSDNFWVLIRAISSERREQRSIFSGTRLYFRAKLSPQGLGKAEQLPVWVVQEDRDDVDLDERAGVFRFPRFLHERVAQAFSLGGGDLALYFTLDTQLPAEDGTFHPDKTMWVTKLFGVFRGTGRPASWIALDEEQQVHRWSAQLAKAHRDLKVLPLWFLDRVGTYEFAFRAACRRRGAGRKVPRAPCIALLELEY